MFVFRKIWPYSPFCLNTNDSQIYFSSIRSILHITTFCFILFLLIVETSFWFIYLFYFIYLFFLQVLAIENKTAYLNN